MINLKVIVFQVMQPRALSGFELRGPVGRPACSDSLHRHREHQDESSLGVIPWGE